MRKLPKITSIKQQKKENRVNVYLDDKFGFGIDLESFVKLDLRVGQELDQEKIANAIKQSSFAKVLEKLISYATLRPRSEAEIRLWLKRKKVDEQLTKDLFATLKRLQLLDDYKFAKWWVEQRTQFKMKSKKAITFELKVKGIAKEISDKVFEETEINEEELTEKLLTKRKAKWERLAKQLDQDTLKQKMYEYLARNGFSWTEIKKAVDKFIEKR